MTIRSGMAIAAVAAAAATFACKAGNDGAVCTPDTIYTCVGTDGCPGKQTCRKDGLGYYGVCICDSTGPLCTPGEYVACRGTEQCVGQQQCDASGEAWGECICTPREDVIEPPDGVPTDADVPPADLPDAPPADVPAEAIDNGPDVPPYEEPAARVLYDLFITPADGFFPWDRQLSADGSVNVDNDAFANSNLPLLADGPYPAYLKQVHGFASYSPIVFQVSVPIDPTSLPADIAASTAPEASVRLLALDADGQVADRAAFQTEYLPFPDDGYWMVRIVPAWPLTAKRYLLVATDGIRDADGAPLGRPRGFAQVLGQAAIPADADPVRVAQVQAEADRVAPLLAGFSDAEHVLAAGTITTAYAYDDPLELQGVMARYVPPSVPPAIPYDLDLDDDGAPDIVRNGQLPGCAMDPSVMGWAIQGTFGPWNLTAPDGHWVPEGDGFQTFDPQQVEFNLMVPEGEGPFPIVLAQHGIAADQGGMCQAARLLVAQGMAVLRFDFPRHGSRGKPGDAMNWGYDFLSVDDPMRVRENFRQAALDIASAIALLDELAPVLDGWPKDAPDGRSELDTQHIAYLGHSLGSIIGMLYLPFSQRIEAFHCNVGGLGMFHLVELYIKKAFGDVYLAQGYQNSAEHVVFAGDGIAYADKMLTGIFGPEGRRVRFLAQEVIGDDTIANVSTEAMGRALALPQLGPVLKAIPGLEAKDAATVESGLMQFQGVVHGDFVGGDEPAADLERRQAVHFLKSWFTTGKAEIITE